MEITIEMGCFKFPLDSMMPTFWSDHKYSLLAFMDLVHTGIKGVVQDNAKRPVFNATLTIKKPSDTTGKNVTTTNLGEYWRLLSPGNYTLELTHPDFLPYEIKLELKAGQEVKVINVTMKDLPCNSEGCCSYFCAEA